jgi:tryptophan 2,3-dioxygenase
MSVTYPAYLKLDRLLELQEPLSEGEHDEMLFIVIHQVYELWFKLVLHELRKIIHDLKSGNLFAAITTFQRCRTIMKTLVGQLDILETMTPISFISFRDRLETSSGFQSVQFREFEFLLGYKRAAMLDHYNHDPEGRARLEGLLSHESVADAFYTFLETRGVTLPASVVGRDRSASVAPSDEIQAALVKLYRTSPETAILFELMTDFDEGLQEWRYRHVKMVERTIGNKTGTGGSPGADFLRKSLFISVFPDLWAVRHQF